jgi:hypothetical protein
MPRPSAFLGRLQELIARPADAGDTDTAPDGEQHPRDPRHDKRDLTDQHDLCRKHGSSPYQVQASLISSTPSKMRAAFFRSPERDCPLPFRTPLMAFMTRLTPYFLTIFAIFTTLEAGISAPPTAAAMSPMHLRSKKPAA